jgi:kynurenine formamidase
MDVEALAEACAAQGRNEFFFAVAPLHIQGGTGSPVTPICIL